MDVQLLRQIVLYERLPARHPEKEKVFGDLKRSLAGASGEQRTAELLKRELDLEGKISIFRSVYLPYLNGFAQIDVLVLHAHFVCALEVKNMVGEFYFDTDNFQFHRLLNGRQEGMRNPETQLHRAVKAAEIFFGCKVHGTIVLSSRSGKVALPPKLYLAIALDYLPFHIENFADPTLSLDFSELEGFLRRSRGHYSGLDLLKKYKLTRESFLLGVRCLECRASKVEWSRLRWRCKNCGSVSTDAHEFALQEYAILFGNEIKTEFAYSWLGVKDKYVLYRMLEKLTIKSNVRGRRLIVERNELLVDRLEGIYK